MQQQQHQQQTSATAPSHTPNGRKSLFGAAALDSVSTRKPPVHPNHPNPPSALASAGGAASHFGGSRQSIVAPVHSSSNNRLHSNTTFQNNQYTFSLNREHDGGGAATRAHHASAGGPESGEGPDAGLFGCGGLLGHNNGGGYLDTRPLSSASPYSGPAGRASRGTKSDIGLSSCRRTSTSSSSTGGGATAPGGGSSKYARSSSRASTRSHHQMHSQSGSHQSLRQHQQQPAIAGKQQTTSGSSSIAAGKSKMQAIKSEFLRSYLNQSSQLAAVNAFASPSSSDYLEHYKASLAEYNALRMFPSLQQQQQDVQTTQPRASLHHPHRSINPNELAKPMSNSRSVADNGGSATTIAISNIGGGLGPLLYLDSAEAAERAMLGRQHPHRQQQQQQQQPQHHYRSQHHSNQQQLHQSAISINANPTPPTAVSTTNNTTTISTPNSTICTSRTAFVSLQSSSTSASSLSVVAPTACPHRNQYQLR